MTSTQTTNTNRYLRALVALGMLAAVAASFFLVSAAKAAQAAFPGQNDGIIFERNQDGNFEI